MKGTIMPTTQVRAQLMKSVGSLAQEHARIDAALEDKRKELSEMGAMQTPTGDDLVRALANEIAAEEARIQAKRDALARAEAQLHTQARDDAAARARARQAEYEQLVAELHAAEDRRCEAIDKIEHHTRGLRDAIKAAFAAADEVRGNARDLAAMGGVLRPNLLRLNQAELASRCGLRMAGVMAAGPGAGRLGGVTWGSPHSAYPHTAEGWGSLEREFCQPDLAVIIEEAKHDAAE
jgi:hypothetical protein